MGGVGRLLPGLSTSMKAGDVKCPLAALVPKPGWLTATTGARWECGRAVGFGGRFCPHLGCAGRQQPSA